MPSPGATIADRTNLQSTDDGNVILVRALDCMNLLIVSNYPFNSANLLVYLLCC